jgi:hypothetical protein
MIALPLQELSTEAAKSQLFFDLAATYCATEQMPDHGAMASRLDWFSKS